MDLALKKIELINWLTHLQSESVLNEIESIRKSSIGEIFDNNQPKSEKELKIKLEKSNLDIEAGRMMPQEEVDSYFKEKNNR